MDRDGIGLCDCGSRLIPRFLPMDREVLQVLVVPLSMDLLQGFLGLIPLILKLLEESLRIFLSVALSDRRDIPKTNGVPPKHQPPGL